MDFSSSSDDDGILAWQLRRHRDRLVREDAAVARVESGSGDGQGLASVDGRPTATLPSGATIAARRGTIYLPVPNRFVHVNDAKARPQNYFGDPSVRDARRPPLAAHRVVLKELSSDGEWHEVALSDASVTGIFVLERVEPDGPGKSNNDANRRRDPLDVLGACQGRLDSRCAPCPIRVRRGEGELCPQIQRKVDYVGWSRAVDFPESFQSTADVTWPTAGRRRLCHATTVDAWGTIWGMNDDDHTLRIVTREAVGGERSGCRDELSVKAVAVVPPSRPAADHRTLGLARLPFFHGDADVCGGGAMVFLTSQQVTLASLPKSEGTGERGIPASASVIACPFAEELFPSWCVTRDVGEVTSASSVELAVGSARGVVGVRFRSEAGQGDAWSTRRNRLFPKTTRVTALGAVGSRYPITREPRFLLAGMRNGTIQLCPSQAARSDMSRTLDNTLRHRGASVISLHQLSTHDCQFASVSSQGEIRVWDLRYFTNTTAPVCVVREPVHMNFDGRVKECWCGDLVAVFSGPGGFCEVANAARPGASFTIRNEGDAPAAVGNPILQLTRTGTGCDLFFFDDAYTRCVSLEVL